MRLTGAHATGCVRARRLSTFALANQYNLTFLYHPFLANQPQHLLFERFFGFGFDEPHRFYEACAQGSVGEECTEFLPCLKVRLR